jgi:tryptophan synthase beta chain
MTPSNASSKSQKLPDATGHFGVYGGRYVAETLMPALIELERAWARLRRDASFSRELQTYIIDVHSLII